jgi:lysozyme family protein
MLSAEEYRRMYDLMSVRDSPTLSRAVALVLDGQPRYESLSSSLAFPLRWQVIGSIHYREGECDFGTHLANGDSLNARTVHEPKGLFNDDPPYPWERAARWALQMHPGPGLDGDVLGRELRWAEHYNGLGYWYRRIMSPYVWASTSNQESGLFVSDGVFDSVRWDMRPGIAAILWKLGVR